MTVIDSDYDSPIVFTFMTLTVFVVHHTVVFGDDVLLLLLR